VAGAWGAGSGAQKSGEEQKNDGIYKLGAYVPQGSDVTEKHKVGLADKHKSLCSSGI
jgi:hypothetical protein